MQYFLFIQPLLQTDCQPHPSHQGNSSHLLSISLAQYKDSCSPHTHCQIVLCLVACETHLCFCQPYLWHASQPFLNHDDFLSLLSLTMGFAFALLVLVCLFLWLRSDFLPCSNSVSLDSICGSLLNRDAIVLPRWF